MSGAACEQWRGELAMSAIGRLDDEEQRGLDAHLEGCSACRAEARSLTGAAGALAMVDRADLGNEGAAPSVPATVVALDEDRERVRPRHMVRRAAVGLAAAAAIAAAALALSGTPATAGRTVALSGTPGVHATASLTPNGGGTHVVLVETGQAASQVFAVSMRSGSGSWWSAGTYRTGSGTGSVRVELSCAAAADQITDVWITDQSGRTVLSGTAA